MREIEVFLADSETPDADYIFFRDRWLPNTCGWILKDAQFCDWMYNVSTRSRVLWLHGAAASGKSILSSFIINHLAQLGWSCQYFFVRFGDENKRSMSSLLQSLALQMAQSLPAFRQGLLRQISEGFKLDTRDAQPIWNRVFKSILFKIRQENSLFWVVDGLEESDDARTFVRLISDLDLALTSIRVLIISRKTQALTTSFKKLAHNVHFDSLHYEGSSTDIQHFVAQELDVSGDEIFRNHVAHQILGRAQGNFLWVHLAVQRINECHTADHVEHALRQLPSGMQALYDRMAETVAALPQDEKTVASTILAWITCSLRSLSIKELSLILEGEDTRPLDLQRSISDLCGGFVVVDNDENVAMIHQTAREYLVDSPDRPYHIDHTAAHELLFLRCMSCLTDLSLRSKILRKQATLFLDYAATSWFFHLSNVAPSNAKVSDTLQSFFKGPSVLTWIQFLASTSRLRILVLSSTQISKFALKQKGHLAARKQYFEAWAKDLVKLVGKFGANLVRLPESIYKLIPPFCPDESIVYQQFGKKEKNALQVTGNVLSTWDDALARLSLGPGIHATSIRAAGGRIAVMSPTGSVIIYFASTCEESRRINHKERILRMDFDSSGSRLVTYGYYTTRIWETATGRCLASAQNPSDRPRPHTIIFTDEGSKILAGSDDRKIRSLSLRDRSAVWHITADIDEQALEGTIVNSPTCMSLSPDGLNVALGYRGHPLSVWEVEGPSLVGHCMRVIDDSTQSEAIQAWGEVIQITWHPYTGEVIGLYMEGVVFRWHPYHDETEELHTGANSIVVSQDGKCLAAGDPNGIVKLYSLSGFHLVYQFASQDPVYDLCFAPDSRRLYDVRGSHGNVWEPDALIRLSESADDPSDADDESGDVLSNISKIDIVTALAAQPGGRMHCRGTESGSVGLVETNNAAVLEVHSSKSFMGIEHIVWSNDGRLLAFSDLSGRVFVQCIIPASGATVSCKVEQLIEIAVNVADGAICQLMFNPISSMLLVYTSATVSAINLALKSLSHSRKMPDTVSLCRWISHPAQPDLLFAFGSSSLSLWTWSDLTQIKVINLAPENNPEQGSEISLDQSTSSISAPDSRISVDKLLITEDGLFVLVQYSSTVDLGRRKRNIFVYNIAKVLMTKGSTVDSESSTDTNADATPHSIKDDENYEELSLDDLLVPLPPELTSQIEVPMAILSPDRLVFLDHNFWLCSWRLPLRQAKSFSRRPSAGGTMSGGTMDIKRHYVLPGDWISPDSIALCTVMGDGTLLCPRNGDVAVVRCATVRT